MHPASEALAQMIAALGLEVAAVKAKAGGSRIDLRGGQRVGDVGDSWLYAFPLSEEGRLRDDTPIRLSCSDRDVYGTIVSVRDGVLVVSLQEDLGPSIATARLVTDDSFLVQRLKDRLEAVRDGTARFHLESAERVLDPADVPSNDLEPAPAVLVGDGRLNDEQLSAVRRSLGSQVTYVWGPPGTGKTSTVARIVEAHYRAGRSVLLVSNTNIAVDTALERVASRLKGEPEFYEGLVLRIGPIVKEELRAAYGKQIDLAEVVARLGGPLIKERAELRDIVAPLEVEIVPLSKAVRDYDTLAATRRDLVEGEGAVSDLRASSRDRLRAAREHRQHVAGLEVKLARARSMGRLRRFLFRLDPERILAEMASGERAALVNEDAARALQADADSKDAKLGALRGEIERLVAETRAYPPESQARAAFTDVGTRLNASRSRIQDIERELKNLEKSLLEKCRVAAMTAYRSYLDTTLSRAFDVVLVDEASMLMLPLVYYAAGLATHSVTVAGDFRQLPSIVMSSEPQALAWLKRDVFEKAGIPDRLATGKPTPQLVALRTQFRMQEPICEILNAFFYTDRPLRSDPSVNRQGREFPFGSDSLFLVDTSSLNPWAAFPTGSLSRYNLLHAVLVRNAVSLLSDAGYLPADGSPNDAIGVISPYAVQARLIQTLIEDRLGPAAAGIAATVHRFQGNEKDAIFLDLTDSTGAPVGMFLRATSREEEGARLLNVALSRARRHVVLVANVPYLRSNTDASAIIRPILDHFERHARTLSVKKFLPVGERELIEGLAAATGSGFALSSEGAGLFNEGSFYPAFRNDLETARKSIVLFSPFATEAGTSRWIELLRAAVLRGVHVRLLTQPPVDGDADLALASRQLVQSLRSIGVVVDLRLQMHEKIAVIDGNVLWHGSLNVLSHRNTHESVLRIESREVCDLVGRLVGKDGRRRDAPELHVAENPKCTVCGGPTVWVRSRDGIVFRCEDRVCAGVVGGRRPDDRSRRNRRTGRPAERTDRARIACPRQGCDGQLTERKGKFGRFLGCSRYPRCRHTQNVE